MNMFFATQPLWLLPFSRSVSAAETFTHSLSDTWFTAPQCLSQRYRTFSCQCRKQETESALLPVTGLSMHLSFKSWILVRFRSILNPHSSIRSWNQGILLSFTLSFDLFLIRTTCPGWVSLLFPHSWHTTGFSRFCALACAGGDPFPAGNHNTKGPRCKHWQ